MTDCAPAPAAPTPPAALTVRENIPIDGALDIGDLFVEIFGEALRRELLADHKK